MNESHANARRGRRVAAAFLVIAFMGAFAALTPVIRTQLLRTAGRFLVINTEKVAHADVIVVAIDADGVGVLQAADLVHSGVAPQVAVFADDDNDPVRREFVARGGTYQGSGARIASQLESLGMRNILVIPWPATGTEEQASTLPGWCDQQRFESVILVTNSDHSRRTRRVIRRSLKEHHARCRIAIVPSHYSRFDPDHWWTTRDGVRTEIEELEKLLLDMALHPLA